MKRQSKDQQGKEIQAEKEFLESLVDTAQVLMVVLDTEGRIVLFNRACQETTGYSAEEVLGRNWFDLFLPERVKEGVREVFQKLLDGQLPGHYETPILTKDGQERLIEWDSTFLCDKEGTVRHVFGMGRHITEHEGAEEALRRSQEETARSHRLLLALSQAAQAVQRARTPDEVYRAVGEEVAGLGYNAAVFTLTDDRLHLTIPHLTMSKPTMLRAAEKLTGLLAQNFSFPLVPGGVYQRIIFEGEATFCGSFTEPIAEALPGPLRPLASRVAALLGIEQGIVAPLTVGGDVHGLLIVTGVGLTEADVPAVSAFANQTAIALENAQLYQEVQQRAKALQESKEELRIHHDHLEELVDERAAELRRANEQLRQEIDERKRAEETLQESEEKYRNLVERANDGIVIIQDTLLRYANPRLAEIIGYTVEELTGTPFTDYVHPDELPKVVDRYERRMAGEDVTPTYETAFRHRDGRKIHVEVNAGIITYQEKPADLVIVRDITERKRAEETLARHSRELEALNAVVAMVSRSLRLEEVAQQAIDLIHQHLGYTNVALLLVDEKTDELYIKAACGYPQDVQSLRLKIGQEGITGWVATHREPLLVPDVRQDPRYVMGAEGILSELAVPVMLGEELLGVLDVESDRLAAFGEDDLNTLTILAGQIAVAIGNARLFEAERKRAAQLAVVNRVARQTVSILDLDQLLQEVVTAIRQGFDYYNVALFLLDETASEMEMRAMAGGFEDAAAPDYRQAVGEGMIGWTAETGQPLLANDIRQEPRYIPGFLEEPLTRSELCVPLKLADRVMGVLDVQDTQLNAFDETDLLAMRTLADQMAVAIENARLFGEAKRRFEETTALYQTSLDITARLEMSGLLKSIVERAVTLLGAEAGGVYLYDPQREELKLTIGYDYTEKYVGTTLKPGEGMAGKVFQTGEPLIVDDYRTWEGRALVYDADQPFTAVLGVPLKWRDRIIGVLAIDADAQKRTFNQDDVWLATLFANQTAVAIENARIYEEERKRVTQLELIGGITQRIASILDLDELLSQVARLIGDTFGYYYTSILLVEADSNELVLRAATGPFVETLIGRLRLKIGEEGISGWVAHSGEPLLVNDVSREPRHHFVEESKDTQSELAVPIKLKGEVIGVLDIQSVELEAFSQDDVSILQTLADQLAFAIENARLYEAEAQRRQEAETLRQATMALTSTLDLEEALDRILEQLHRVVAYNSASVQLLRGDYLEIVGGRGFADPSAVIGLRFPVPGDNPNTRVIEGGEPVILADAQAAHAPFREPPHDHIRSWLGVPVHFREQTIGLITLDSTELGHFTADHARLAAAFANQAAIALENARLFMATHRQADQLEALRQVTQDFIALQDLDTLLHQIIERAMQLLDGEAGGLYLYRPERDVLEWTVAIGDNLAPIGTTLGRGEGLSGKVWVTGKPLIVGDYSTWADRSPRWPEVSATVIGVPVQWGDEFLGVLNIRAQSDRGRFTSGDAELLSQFAAQAAIAIQNARLYEQITALAEELEARVQERTAELAHKAQELSFLYQASVALSSSLEVEEVLGALAQQAVLAMDATDCTICELQEDTLVVVASYRDPALAWQDPEIGRRYLLADYPATREAIEKGQPLRVRVDDPLADEVERAELQELGYTALLQVHIVSRDQVLGIVEVFDKKPEREFSESDASLLQTIANQAGMAMERAHLFRQVREERNYLELLYEVSRKLSASLDLEQALHDIFRVSVAATGASRGSIFVFDDEGRVAHRILMRDLTPAEADEVIDRVLRKGLAGWVLEHKQPTIAFDTSRDERWLPFPEDTEPTGSAMVIPFIERDRVRGLLTLVHPQSYHFNQAHLDFLSSIAHQVAVVIERARLHEHARRRAIQLATAAEVARDATSTLDVGQLLTSTVDLIHDRFDLYYAGIFLIDEAGQYAVLQAGSGEAGQQMLRQGHKLRIGGTSMVGQCVASAQARIALDVGKEAIRFDNPLLPETRSEMALPLISRGRVIGAMTIQSDRPAAFSDEDVTALQTLADQLANAIENARLYEETRRRAQEVAQQKEQTDAIVQSMADGLIVTDVENKLVLANPAAEKLLKFNLKDAIGRDVGANIRDDRLRQIVRDTLDMQQAGYEVDIELTDPYDGSQKIMRAHTAMVNDPAGQPMGIVTTLRDVTHEREVQRLKDELVSTVSHELRTPMTSVLGFSELLLTRRLSEEKRQLYVQTIHKEAQRLSALINDFLDIQRMERGQQEYRFEEVDLGELARDAVATYSGQSEAHTLTLDLPPVLPPVQADPDRLKQVFGNLLSNAIKFSPGGGTVSVSVQAEDDEIHVAVSDEGIGIPAEALPHIFEEFFRVDSSDRREIKGTGLGLAICKGIVEAHRGRIWAESQLGIGTIVTFSLPIMTRERILVIDDEKDIRLMFQRLLSEGGYEVLTAANGQEGLLLMEAERPDLVILDISMPVMNGYQFLERVREDRRGKDIPVIAISGVDTDIDRLTELGMDEFLSKPFSSTVLLETMQRLLKSQISNPKSKTPKSTIS